MNLKFKNLVWVSFRYRGIALKYTQLAPKVYMYLEKLILLRFSQLHSFLSGVTYLRVISDVLYILNRDHICLSSWSEKLAGMYVQFRDYSSTWLCFCFFFVFFYFNYR